MRRLFFLIVLILNTSTVFAHNSGKIRSNPECEILLRSDESIEEIFQDRQLGQQILEFILTLDAQISAIEFSGDSAALVKLATSAEGRSKLKLLGYVRDTAFPVFRRYIDNAQYLTDEDLGPLAREEQVTVLKELAQIKEELLNQLIDLMISEPTADSVIVEITRAKDQRLTPDWIRKLTRMYVAAAPKMRWSVEIISIEDDIDSGGYRRAVLRIQGPKAYQFLHLESGTHREIVEGSGSRAVHRNNRTHTDYADVFVYNEPQNSDLGIRPQDVHIETMRASGAGGQHVNRTDSAVRVRHIPTGLEVSIQSSRSQHQNRQEALRILAAKFAARQQALDREQAAAARNTRPVALTDENRYVRTYDSRYNPMSVENLLVHGNLEPYLRERLVQLLKLRMGRN